MSKIKKFLIFFLCPIFLNLFFLSIIFNEVYAEDDIFKKESEVSVEEFWNSYNNIYSLNNENLIYNTRLAMASQCPISYDLRKNNPLGLKAHGNITVKAENQGQEGLCWAFASLGSLRTYLSVKGFNSSNNIDLSEWHLNYLESQLFKDEYGESRKIGTAGSFEYAKNYFKYNNGPIYESKLKYGTSLDISSDAVLKSIDNMKPNYYVHSILEFADFTKVRNIDNSITIYSGYSSKTVNENELMNVRNKVKEHIMNNGGLYATVNILKSENTNTGKQKTESKNGKHYYNSGYICKNMYSVNNVSKTKNTKFYTSRHAMTIIGWDDNYSKNNFKCCSVDDKGNITYVTPKNNGAYIVLNSYGENGSSTDKYGISYVSYEDYNIEYGLYGFISVDTKPKYKTYVYSNQSDYLKMKKNITKSFLKLTDKNNETKINEKEKILISNEVIKCTDSAKKVEVLDIVANDFPELSSINVTSPANGTYKEGQEITIVATYNNNVYANINKLEIKSGTAPILNIKFGNGTIRTATFQSVNGKNLIYKYKIVSGDSGKLALSSYSGSVFNSSGNEYVIISKSLGGNTINASTTIYLKGDVNGNKIVDLSDLLKIRRYIANQSKKNKNLSWELSNDEAKRADVDENGKVDLKDVLMLRRYIAAAKSEIIKKKNPNWYWSS